MNDMTNQQTTEALDTEEALFYFWEQCDEARQQQEQEFLHYLAEWEANHDEDGNPITEEEV